MRALWLRIAILLGLTAAACGGWSMVANRRFRRELDQAEQDLTAGRYALARQQFLRLSSSRPQSAEVAYQLGLCEEKLGHLEAAVTAWSGIQADSPLFVKAAVGRVLTLMNMGRYSQAEDLLATIPGDNGPYAQHVRYQTEVLLRFEGRKQEARELIAKAWQGAPDPAEVLKRLYELDDARFPINYVKEALKRGDPNDDRVWLGQANLAIWAGRLEDATRWLDACVRARPEDQPVWLARLSLAMLSGDLDGTRRALQHVRAASVLPIEVPRIRAWLAAAEGNDREEQRSLLALVAEEPGDATAWARLAELAYKAGRRDESDSFRKKQGEASAQRKRYDRLIMQDDRVRHVDELAQLARDIGRPIEARGWSLIQNGQAATLPLLPANTPGMDGDQSGRMLASLVEDLPPSTDVPRTRSPTERPYNLPAFTDDAEKAGLGFIHDNGHAGSSLRLPETMCGGVGLLDYDGDGWLDVYAVQGGAFPPSESIHGDGDRLFHNSGDGTFEDVTARAGISSFARGYGHGVTAGDYDNDGRPDVFVTRWHSYALYRNKGEGQFEDVTDRSGLAGDRDWPTSAAFADLDGDGDLDLYVCHYLTYDPGKPELCDDPGSPGKRDCMPRDYPSLADHVFRNDNGKFVDVTKLAGFVDPDGRGLGVVAAHLDDDDKIDLYVANDMSANYLFRNLGSFRFEETGEASGAAAGADGLYKSGMGIACGDLDGDGFLDLGVTNYYGESTTFYRNIGGGFFADHTALVGLMAPSRPLLGFGIAFPDVNNDGWLDMLSTNGHVLDSGPRMPLSMPLQLMTGAPGGHLTEVSDRAGEPFQKLHLGRGLAIGDLDNDGRLDAVVLNQNEPLVYLHNNTHNPGHFIRFSLEGTKSNRDGVGARIAIVCDGRRRMSERIGGGSYQSASDPRLHFGLGTSQLVELVEVRWPSGQLDHHAGLIADREYRLREGATPLEVKNSLQPPTGPNRR
jgi:enediyne biosynthesis protein E4